MPIIIHSCKAARQLALRVVRLAFCSVRQFVRLAFIAVQYIRWRSCH